jgi:hypothetical protein
MLKAINDGKVETEKRLDVLVANYVTIRDHIKQAEEVMDKHLAPFKAKQQEITAELLKLMAEQGAEACRTKYGTVSALVRHTAALADPDAFMTYVRENDMFELLDRRANATACREHAKYNDGALPPGVKINSLRYVGVRTS